MAKLMGRGDSAPEGRSVVGLEGPSSLHGWQNSEPVSRHPDHLGHPSTFWSKHSSVAVFPSYLAQVRPRGRERGSVSHGGDGL